MVDDSERYAAELIPSDYASWRYCIEVKCALALTPAFLKARIAVLSDLGNEETQRFARLYGEAHLNRVLAWFRRAEREA
ncbi:hypothetical protein MARPU_13125 [Marichromatium purpuratum 984]|uniref:Uncharacterized protein n=1 Tax=Marichromatium purpuratum 984 TaxID=765910 RepID=W0E6L4_MARPU|nr:hypothetical protein [Marichromatium purpuratum]AHF04676.1 hypothetical protein MARPU_13125 [Marichromatium purpuratum 984]